MTIELAELHDDLVDALTALDHADTQLAIGIILGVIDELRIDTNTPNTTTEAIAHALHINPADYTRRTAWQ